MRHFFQLILLGALLNIPGFLNAQKGELKEVGLFLGFANYLGELGGSSKIGRPFINDLELGMSRPSIGGFYRYNLNSFIGIRANLFWGVVTGNDKLAYPRAVFADEWYRWYRNLSFKASIFEFSAQVELNFMKYEPRRKRYRFAPYVFIGIGGFQYTPKAKYTDPETESTRWVDLRSLGTEGQGSVEYPDRQKYKPAAMCIPLGFGFKYAINRYWNLGFELGHRITTTDYLDDVSKTYPGEKIFANNYDEETTKMVYFLSRRSQELDPNGIHANVTATNMQRGDPHDFDHYMFMGALVVIFNISGGKIITPKF